MNRLNWPVIGSRQKPLIGSDYTYGSSFKPALAKRRYRETKRGRLDRIAQFNLVCPSYFLSNKRMPEPSPS